MKNIIAILGLLTLSSAVLAESRVDLIIGKKTCDDYYPKNVDTLYVLNNGMISKLCSPHEISLTFEGADLFEASEIKSIDYHGISYVGKIGKKSIQELKATINQFPEREVTDTLYAVPLNDIQTAEISLFHFDSQVNGTRDSKSQYAISKNGSYNGTLLSSKCRKFDLETKNATLSREMTDWNGTGHGLETITAKLEVCKKDENGEIYVKNFALIGLVKNNILAMDKVKFVSVEDLNEENFENQ